MVLLHHRLTILTIELLYLSLKECPAAVYDPDAVTHGSHWIAAPHELSTLLCTKVGEHLGAFDTN